VNATGQSAVTQVQNTLTTEGDDKQLMLYLTCTMHAETNSPNTLTNLYLSCRV
jgi:hypothetical protein